MLRGLWTLVCVACLVLALSVAWLWGRSYARPAGLIHYGAESDSVLMSNHGKIGYAPIRWPAAKPELGTYVYWGDAYYKWQGWGLARVEGPPGERYFLTRQPALAEPVWKDTWGLMLASNEAPTEGVSFKINQFPHWFALLILMLQPVLWLQVRSRRPDRLTGERVGFFSRVFGLASVASLLVCVAALGVWGISYRAPVSASVRPAWSVWTLSEEQGRGQITRTRDGESWTRSFPGWVPAAGAAVLPIVWGMGTRGRRLRRRRLVQGLCPRCGMELGETPGRCEPCGWRRPVG